MLTSDILYPSKPFFIKFFGTSGISLKIKKEYTRQCEIRRNNISFHLLLIFLESEFNI